MKSCEESSPESLGSADMSNVDPLLVETINALLGDHCAPEVVVAAEGGMDVALWAKLESAGLTLVGVPESAGGSGGTLFDMAAIVKAAGYHAAPVPLGDSLVAASLAALRGLDVPAGPLAVAAGPRVTWGPVAGHVLSGSAWVSSTFTDTGTNYAGEPWGVGSFAFSETDRGAMALNRALLMAGGLQRAVDLTLQYASERSQFGKPIGKQQVIQHYLAEMAGEACATEAAADTALELVAAGVSETQQLQAIGAAKAVAGRAVGIINRLAHQIHGAIGFTDEHRLQLTTRRLWAWRDEHGTESEWAAFFGQSLVAAGGSALWPLVTTWPPVS